MPALHRIVPLFALLLLVGCGGAGSSTGASPSASGAPPAAAAAPSPASPSPTPGTLTVEANALVGMEGLSLAGAVLERHGSAVGALEPTSITASQFAADPWTIRIEAGTYDLLVFAGQPTCRITEFRLPVCGLPPGTPTAAPGCCAAYGPRYFCTTAFEVMPGEDVRIVLEGLPETAGAGASSCPVKALTHTS